MTILAFTDGDGYYQVEVADGYPLPDWAKGMTPTSIIPPAQPSQSEIVAKATKWARAARLEFFKILDGLQVSAFVTGDNATAQSIETALT